MERNVVDPDSSTPPSRSDERDATRNKRGRKIPPSMPYHHVPGCRMTPPLHLFRPKETAHILKEYPSLVDNLTRFAEKYDSVIQNFAKNLLERINDYSYDHKMVTLESTEVLYVDLYVDEGNVDEGSVHEGSVHEESTTEVNAEIPFRGKILKHLPHLDI